MPRSARIDIEAGLYHVIARGVERRAVFRTDTDRLDFLGRLERLLADGDITLFAYVLMDNHFHLVLRRDATRLGQFMQRLLTGYSVTFNRRHRRVGHLFQNRYTAVLCDDDVYLLTLVRYVHLNPVRAGVVTDPQHYRWSSQAAYESRRPAEWIDTHTVLEMAGGRRAFARFVRDGIGEPRRDDITGRGMRPSGREPVDDQPRLWFGGQALGTAAYAQQVLRRVSGRSAADAAFAGGAADLGALARAVAQRAGLAVDALQGAAADPRHQRRPARADSRGHPAARDSRCRGCTLPAHQRRRGEPTREARRPNLTT